MFSSIPAHEKRQNYGPGDGGADDLGDDWYSNTGEIVKYSIIVALILLFVLFVVGGLAHGRRRIARGQQPLRYHAWLFRRTHPRHPPSRQPQNQPRYTYNMPTYRPQQENTTAPPAYSHADVPPAYQFPDKSEFNGVHTNPVDADLESGESSLARPQPAVSASSNHRWH